LRGFLVADSGGCEIRAPFVARLEGYPELCARVAELLGGREVVLDGDLVSLDARGRPVLRELLRGRGFLAFAATDLLWLDGRDLRSEPLAERKRLLAELLPQDTGPLYKVFTLTDHGRALYQAARKMELEGILAKRLADPYGPETVWYQIRNPDYRGAAAPVERPAARLRARGSAPVAADS
jgi:bifunctional non-homologous end joining protein LigD